MARFLTRHAKWELRPLTPVTFPEPERSNQGPDSDPVGLGVALSNILLRSFLSDRHSCDAGWAANIKRLENINLTKNNISTYHRIKHTYHFSTGSQLLKMMIEISCLYQCWI